MAAEGRGDGHDDAGEDLHRTDDVHELLRGARREPVDPRRQIGRPIDHEVEELVEAEQDRRDGEPGPEDHERLIDGSAVRTALRTFVCRVMIVAMSFVPPFASWSARRRRRPSNIPGNWRMMPRLNVSAMCKISRCTASYAAMSFV